MPNTKSAKKKLRKDIKRTKHNRQYLTKIERTLRLLKKAKDEKEKKELLNAAYSIIDKAAKRHIIHKNKAARLKAKASKLVNQSKNKKK